jgi:hypothetical protein
MKFLLRHLGAEHTTLVPVIVPHQKWRRRQQRGKGSSEELIGVIGVGDEEFAGLGK